MKKKKTLLFNHDCDILIEIIIQKKDLIVFKH